MPVTDRSEISSLPVVCVELIADIEAFYQQTLRLTVHIVIAREMRLWYEIDNVRKANAKM